MGGMKLILKNIIKKYPLTRNRKVKNKAKKR